MEQSGLFFDQISSAAVQLKGNDKRRELSKKPGTMTQGASDYPQSHTHVVVAESAFKPNVPDLLQCDASSGTDGLPERSHFTGVD